MLAAEQSVPLLAHFPALFPVSFQQDELRLGMADGEAPVEPRPTPLATFCWQTRLWLKHWAQNKNQPLHECLDFTFSCRLLLFFILIEANQRISLYSCGFIGSGAISKALTLWTLRRTTARLPLAVRASATTGKLRDAGSLDRDQQARDGSQVLTEL